MRVISKILLVVVCLYGLTLIISYNTLTRTKKENINAGFFSKPTQESETRDFLSDLSPDRTDFRNKVEKELKILRDSNPFYLLGAYPEPNTTYQNIQYDKPFRGLLPEEDYCERTDQYNLQNQEKMFTEMRFFSDYPAYELPKKLVMKKMGTVPMPIPKRADRYKRVYPIDPKINIFHMDTSRMHLHNKIGTNFLCATQMYNHIPGIQALVHKDLIVDKVHQYIERYEDRQQCFNKTSFFPYTYRLYNENECRAFFNLINSEAYNASLEAEPLQYLTKVTQGVHKSQGVTLLDPEKTLKLNEKYAYGSKCGVESKSLIAQTYISNPLLLDLNNKFDFRVYMLIASTNPLIAYYHDGFLRVSLERYEKFSNNRAAHLTNTFLSKQLISKAKKSKEKVHGMSGKQLNDYIAWDLERFQNYLLKTKKITDKNWLNNYLRPAFQKAMVHLLRMTGDSLWKQSNVYAVHGVDFMLDDQMNLWFIESNPSPLVHSFEKKKKDIYKSVLTNMFEIVFSYYRSRMSRAMKVIHKFEKAIMEGSEVDYDKWRAEYQNAIRNRLEPEYKIPKTNKYKLIMDENLPGDKAYMGLLSPQCL